MADMHMSPVFFWQSVNEQVYVERRRKRKTDPKQSHLEVEKSWKKGLLFFFSIKKKPGVKLQTQHQQLNKCEYCSDIKSDDLFSTTSDQHFEYWSVFLSPIGKSAK